MNRAAGTRTIRALFLLLSAVLVTCAILGAACSKDRTAATSLPTAVVGPPTTGAGDGTDTAGFAPQTVTFTTEDGVTLSGSLFGSGTQGVVLAHMYPADQTSWYPVAERLAEEGYFVLTFDFRGYGESEGTKDIQYLDKDVAAAVQYTRGAGAEEVVLVGASMGGTACLKAAAELQTMSSIRLAGVVTLSAPVGFKGLSAAEAVPNLVVPLLFMAAEHDVGANGASELEQLSGGEGDLGIVAGDAHGTDLFDSPQAEQVWTLLLDFLQATMRTASQ
jgi:dienelactone hydrolase